MRNLTMATKTIGGGNLTVVRARKAEKGQGSALGKKLIATFLMISMLFCMSGVMANDSERATGLTDVNVFNYKIKNNSEEWDNINNYSERIAARQIPSDELEKISTPLLIDYIFNDYYVAIMFAFNTIEQGYTHLRNNYNSVYELETRDDAIDCLINRYNQEISNIHDNSFDIICIEAFLSQDIYEGSMNQEQISFLNEANTAYNIIQRDNGEKFTKSLLNYSPNLRGTPFNVYTPNGTAVPGIIDTKPNFSPSDIDASISNLRYSFPGATFYPTTHDVNSNCHTYAWYSQADSPKFWMYTPKPYMTDGSYRKIDSYSAKNGTRIYWSNDSHSAISMTSQASKIISRWGSLCVVEGGLTDNPYSNSGTPISYYHR